MSNAAALIAKRDQLLKELQRVEAQLAARAEPKNASAAPAEGSPRPVPSLVLDALHDIGFLTYSQTLGFYLKARYGRTVAATRFGTLAKDEEKSFKSARPRALWLCHGLTFNTGEAVRRLWARSDWPLVDRIVGPLTGRVIYLRATIRFAELAEKQGELAADADLLKFIAADFARDLGITFRRGEFPLALWRDTAREMLSEIEQEDRQLRQAAAEELASSMSEFELLFGRAARPVLLPGGQSDRQEA